MNSEMTIERAVAVLKAHNVWRRADSDQSPKSTMQDVREIGKAIDVAVRELEKIIAHNKEFESLAEAFGCE